jgi:CDP-diglyceride synthetase
VNTYYSVRCFSDIHGADGALSERIIDALLVAAYLLLAFQFGSILRFVVVTTTLFVIATLKYTFLLGPHDHARILQRKIILDTLCTFACLLALAGVLAGWALLASAIWFFAFVIGNIYILLMSDIYKPISR